MGLCVLKQVVHDHPDALSSQLSTDLLMENTPVQSLSELPNQQKHCSMQ